MEILSQFFDYITDTTKKLTHKAVTVISIILVLFLIDNLFGVNYYYNINSKLEAVKNANNLLHDTSLSVNEIKNIKLMREQVINHHNLKDGIYSKINYALEYLGTNIVSQEQNIIHFITSNLFIIIFAILVQILLFVQLTKKNRTAFDDSKYEIVIKIFFVDVVLYIVSLIIAKVFSYIPLIGGNRNYNYCLNVLLNVIMILFFVYDSKTKKMDFKIDFD